MKKKILLIAMLFMFFATFASCDLLSTINAVKGFYTEYQEFSQVYNDATQYTVLNETQLNISDTNIETIIPMNTRVYLMVDTNSDFLYVEQNIDNPRSSLYENAADEGLYIEYVIGDDNVVNPRFPTTEQRFDGNTNANILNDNFSYEDVQNENKTGDRTYELDVVLTQAINLDVLGDFINELKVFDESLTVLDDVICHLVITFDSVDSAIDVTATVPDYTITFDDESTVTFSLNNHTVLKIPENFEMPNVFAEPYKMVAVDDIQLARRVYDTCNPIQYPGTADLGGWVQLQLAADSYTLEGAQNMTVSLYDSAQTEMLLVPGDSNTYSFDILESGTYYLYITPSVDTNIDLLLKAASADVCVTPQATTETVTTTQVDTSN